MSIVYRALGKIKNLAYMFSLRKNNVVFKRGSYATTKSVFEGNCIVGRNSFVADSFIGRGTYLSDDCCLNRTKIGRYCSIASGVKVVSGQHPLSLFVSTSPAFYSDQLKNINLCYGLNPNVKEHKYVSSNRNFLVEIGNDVWIGTDALIMEGINIGDGAVIGAGALITKDVLPYSIVGGVPAKIIKMRFNSEQIDFLLEFKWWEKDINWLSQNYKLFYDIDKFIIEADNNYNF